MKYKIGWFSSGRDKAAQDLLETVYKHIQNGRLQGMEISFVFSNRAPGDDEKSDKFFKLVKRFKIPLITFPWRKFKPNLRKKDIKEWREIYDEQIIKRISKFEVNLIMLAGYMLIVGEKMCQKYPMINLHPAVPGGPKGTWQEVIWKLIKNKAKETGAMIHLVTPELDAGPPLTYCTFSLRGGKFSSLWIKMEEKLKKKSLKEIRREEREEEPLFREIRKEELAREFPLIIYTLEALSREAIDLEKRPSIEPVCLNNKIESSEKMFIS